MDAGITVLSSNAQTKRTNERENVYTHAMNTETNWREDGEEEREREIEKITGEICVKLK